MAKAQIWGLDVIIAVAVMVGALIVFFVFSKDISSVTDKSLAQRVSDAKVIADALVSSGVPPVWDPSTVKRIGIMGEEKIVNASKVNDFYSLADTNYTRTKYLFGSQSDYYIFFRDYNNSDIAIDGIKGVGYPGINQSTILETLNPDEVITIYRIGRYEDEVVQVGIVVW